MTGSVTPTGIERTFDDDTLIVSKTDRHGRITYANDAFLTISRYARHELMGAPHSVLRHPDMPRGVFKLLWDEIQAGREVFAFVKNLAKDGAHYWVLAHVTPTLGHDGSVLGYHSNRRRPDRAAVAAVEPIYGAMLREEARHGRVAGADASLALLRRELEARGITYDAVIFGSAA